jgi:hypothetical protein
VSIDVFNLGMITCLASGWFEVIAATRLGYKGGGLLIALAVFLFALAMIGWVVGWLAGRNLEITATDHDITPDTVELG